MWPIQVTLNPVYLWNGCVNDSEREGVTFEINLSEVCLSLDLSATYQLGGGSSNCLLFDIVYCHSTHPCWLRTLHLIQCGLFHGLIDKDWQEIDSRQNKRVH